MLSFSRENPPQVGTIVAMPPHNADTHVSASSGDLTACSGRDDFDREACGEWAALIGQFRDGSLAWQRETHRNPAGSMSADAYGRGARALARHLAVATDAIGVVDDRCGGRVLESALLLALLRSRGSHPDEQERLVRYLGRRRFDADPVDALLIDACLDPAGTAGRALDRAAALPVVVSGGTKLVKIKS
ncbi:hypothetical protein ADL03_20555 [Nocardia sp. NRRL S-836]|nr:hypothetical protein ADL03_20555 [Nocardia sp. NRRL S-836]